MFAQCPLCNGDDCSATGALSTVLLLERAAGAATFPMRWPAFDRLTLAPRMGRCCMNRLGYSQRLQMGLSVATQDYAACCGAWLLDSGLVNFHKSDAAEDLYQVAGRSRAGWSRRMLDRPFPAFAACEVSKPHEHQGLSCPPGRQVIAQYFPS